ncbi:hypothetical protein [Cellulomonas sp. S1-8]|uniref:hypothetical protein n=1 Tax=Cellulomonas sp. S1-8 TaxID=2904790 RepID=UPI0022438B59|nr:hypothetical protein [Cellulomonas sp. S1-8]UZN03745.1 hypothetical protein OKX07_02030 [Cellulomonas sp. S1-8]
MTTTRRLPLACVLGVALALAGCAGPAPEGSMPEPDATATTPDTTGSAATATTTPDVTAAAAPATGAALDAALAACAELDAMTLPGDDLGLLQEQQRALTVAAEHLRVAADADAGYLDDVDLVRAMAAGAADAVALLEEHGEDPDTWDETAQQAWGAYVFAQVDRITPMFELCNTVDPPDGWSPED